MNPAQRRSLFSLYFAYFADYFSWGAAIAYLSVYIATDQSPFQTLYWRPELALAIAVAAFPIGEVIGSPIFGDLSDSIGRKKILIGGHIGSILSLLICAIAIGYGGFLTFLLGQFLVGFCSGKQAMAQAAIAEIDAKTKSRKLAFLSVLGGIAWITGPYIGNLLLGKPFVDTGGFIWPNVLGMLIFGSSLFCTYFFFEDTYQPITRRQFIYKAFYPAFQRPLFALFLFNLLGWYLVLVSVSYYFIQKFQLSDTQVGIFDNYLALCFTLGGIIGTAWVLHRFRARKILFWMQTSGSFAILALYGSSSFAEFWIYLAVPAITEALIYPAYQTIISEQTSDQNQGKVFGLINAINGLCQLISWWILEILTPEFVGAAIFLSAVLFFASGAFIPLATGKKAIFKIPARKQSLSSPQSQ
jgi:MFS family permease